MFLKRLERRKSGKGRTYWALVESYRTADGPHAELPCAFGEGKLAIDEELRKRGS